MAEARIFFTRDRQRVIGVLILTWAGTTAGMVGDTLREIAALITIFVPLELWHDQSLRHLSLLEFAGILSAVTFIAGVLSEYASVLFYRFKKDLEGRLDAIR